MRRALSLCLAFVLGGAVALAVYLALPAWLHTPVDEPPANFIGISERLATSGQPSPEQLDGLAAQGWEMVINLAPPTSLGSVPDEGYRLGATGITYVNIPVDFSAPSPRDFQQFVALLDDNADRRVLVHCQINKRASTFTFLYRVTRLGVDADEAIEQVHAIWVPDANWRRFMHGILEQAGVDVMF